jgi:putative phosphoribosyl transferase
MHTFAAQATPVAIPAGNITLHGLLQLPPQPHGLVLFAHNSGSSRHSPRNQRVAEFLHEAGLATLLFNLLSREEEPADTFNARLRFDVEFLARRLRAATAWARQQPETAELPLGYFGASSGAAAAFVAADSDRAAIRAIVTRGARIELSAPVVRNLHTPTMLIVGGKDESVAALNLEIWAQLRCEKSIEIIPGAGHLFEEPGALDNVAALAARWFSEHLRNTP